MLFRSCPLLVRPDTTPLAFADATGAVRYPFAIPSDSSYLGMVLFGQWIAQDPAANAQGLAVSAGLRVVVGR